MTEVAPAAAGTTEVPSDAVLIQAVRGGDIAAYGQLYDRHLVAARRVAAAIAADVAERDDLIAEGFTRVLRILRTGEGPDEEFRAYLLTTIRNTMISWRRRDSAVSLVAEVPDVLPGEGSDEPVDDRMHATVAVEAFAGLPQRWREVLWRTEIVGDSPARIAQDLGMTPNGVAALAYRAREGLRQAYLDQHVPEARRRTCRVVSGQLARWVRDDIGDHKAHRITTHLDRCADCRKLADGLKEINEELPATVAPLILGIPVVTHWLSTTGSLASSGAAAGSSGASVLSWATAAKVAAAGAALVTTVTIGASTSDVAPPPAVGGEGTTVQPMPGQPGKGTGVPAGATGSQPASGAQLTSVPPTAPSDGTAAAGNQQATGATGAGGTATNDKQAAKDSKQAAKEESKQAAKESREAAKESKKASKTKTPNG